MALSTYADLQTAIASWMHRGDLTAIIPDLITLGEIRLFRQLRCREMETALSVTISSGVAALPSDYLELKSAYIDATPTRKLQRVEASQIYDQYPNRASTGKPTLIAREGANFIFGPYPDSGYTVKGIYYAKPVAVATTANAVFSAYPDAYLFATLCETMPYTKDYEKTMAWELKLKQVIDAIEQKDAKEARSGGGMMVVTA